MSQFSDAAARLLEKSVTGADRQGITRAKEMLSLANSPLFQACKHAKANGLAFWADGARTNELSCSSR